MSQPKRSRIRAVVVLTALAAAPMLPPPAQAQVAPSAAEVTAYRGLHAAAQRGDVAAIERLAVDLAALEARDGHGRTPLHVAAFARQRAAIRALARAGADLSRCRPKRIDAAVPRRRSNRSLAEAPPSHGHSPPTQGRGRWVPETADRRIDRRRPSACALSSAPKLCDICDHGS